MLKGFPPHQGKRNIIPSGVNTSRIVKGWISPALVLYTFSSFRRNIAAYSFNLIPTPLLQVGSGHLRQNLHLQDIGMSVLIYQKPQSSPNSPCTMNDTRPTELGSVVTICLTSPDAPLRREWVWIPLARCALFVETSGPCCQIGG